ncbi:MAG: hypothetical protein ABIO04_13440 [Ferruginibacter sp.]
MFRVIRTIIAGSLISLAFASCQKETSAENGLLPGVSINNGGGSSSGTATFSLEGAPGGICTNHNVAGTYTIGTPLNASNAVSIDVNVTVVGTYTISTASIDGITFSGTGTFTSIGIQTVLLLGTGTPTSPGTYTFRPGSTSCTFTIDVIAVPVGPVAVYTLAGAPTACTAPVIAGTFYTGVPSAGNTITVTANVTTAGSYTISTNTANGITFSGTGNLTIGTAQSITLTASGTPTAANTSDFTIGTNGCTFQITTTDPPLAVYTLDGAPGVCSSFNVNGTYTTGNALSGTVNTATVNVTVTTAGAYNITTNTVNAMTFSTSGIFATTGSQSITLAGSGTPAAVGTNTFTAGTAGCTFDVTVTAPTSPCSGLVDGKFVMAGQFTLNGFSFGASLGSQYQVSIQDGAVTLDVFFPGGSIPSPGTYSIGSVTMHCLYSNFTDWNATSGSIYVSSDGTGGTIIEFCNVNFSGVPIGGGSISSTGEGRMDL